MIRVGFSVKVGNPVLFMFPGSGGKKKHVSFNICKHGIRNARTPFIPKNTIMFTIPIEIPLLFPT